MENLEYAEETPAEYFLLENGNGMGARAGDDTDFEQDAVADDYNKVAVSEHVFMLAATSVAALYAILFFGKLLWGYNTWETEILNITWNVRDNPQTSITICLIFAAAFLWLWKGAVGKLLALVTFGYILWQFYQWFDMSRHANPDVISQAGWLDGYLLGASWLDPIALLAVAALAIFTLYFLILNIRLAPMKRTGGNHQPFNSPLSPRHIRDN
jgi:hypothetical protein